VSSVVNTLERDGRVERSRDEDDRRVVTVSITSFGVVEVREAYEAQHELERAQYADLSLADRRALAAALETLIGTPLDKSLDGTSED
jgi:DNA-binding MarR family transcriptional regulator